ncbi:MAG TPA: hypothetical protein VGY30_12060 [Solirubrobacteraceae bacterium]|nr:hypothetical protein [Solirubrobacteraceae bacterium]
MFTVVAMFVLSVGCSTVFAATGYVVTQRQGTEVLVIEMAHAGLGLVERSRTCSKCRAAATSSLTASFETGRALLVDPIDRTYATATLAALSALARREAAQIEGAQRIPELGIVAKPPSVTVRAAGRTRIAGIPAAGLEVDQGPLQRRLWYATSLPIVPSRYAAVLDTFGGGASRSLGRALARVRGRLLLRVEVLAQGHWRRLLDTSAVRKRSLSFSLRPPSRARRLPLAGAPLAPRGGARKADVPARLNNLGLGPISRHPQIFAIYWGAFFQESPGFVGVLNEELGQMASGGDGYTGPLGQYGVQAGSFNGFFTLGNPPSSVGGPDFFSIETMLLTHLGNTSPRSWGRFSGTDPIVMIFVPESVVEESGWSGYHFEVPTEQGSFPWNFPAIPWTIVKVPDKTLAPGPTAIFDETMERASHEFVEAATDPYPFTTWVDPAKEPVWELGEAADICSHGNTSPWGELTRIGPPLVAGATGFGTAYSTYWSNVDKACVPESRPSATIAAPANGSTWRCPPVPVDLRATDPLEGSLNASNSTIRWFADTRPITPDAFGDLHLSPGTHLLTVEVTDKHKLTTTAGPVTVTVSPAPTPQVAIQSPAPSSAWGTDQSIPFAGGAFDACDGNLTGAALSWSAGGAPLSTGNAFSMPFPLGAHTVTLTATNSSGVTASVPVTFTVEPPSGNPSPAISLPLNNANVDINSEITFSGSATDPHDGTLSGNSLQWYDTYSDSLGGGQSHVHLGSGNSFTARLPFDALPATHTISLVATDSLGHSATTSVVVQSANIQ